MSCLTDRRRWLCLLASGVVVAAAVFLRAQMPRASITLEPPGPAAEFMFTPHQRTVAFLPDSRRLITTDWRQPSEPGGEPEHFELRLWDARTGKLVAPVVEGPAASLFAWSADGASFATGIDTDEIVAVWRSEDGSMVWQAEQAGAAAWRWRHCFFVDQTLCAMSNDGLEIIDLQTRKSVRPLDCELWQACTGRHWSAANGLQYMKNPTRIVDLARGKIVLALDPGVRSQWGRLASDGRFFMYWGEDYELVVWDLNKEKEHRYGRGFGNQFLAFAPDAQTVAVHDEPDHTNTWRGRLRECGVPLHLHFSRLVVFDAPTERELFVRDGGIFGVFSPDGQTLAVLREDNVVELWDWPRATPWLAMLVCGLVTMAMSYACLRLSIHRGERGENREGLKLGPQESSVGPAI
jgi:WD40 repeat protein